MGRGSKIVALLAALALGSCDCEGDPLTEIMVQVDSDIPVPEALSRVTLSVRSSAGGAEQSERLGLTYELVTREEGAEGGTIDPADPSRVRLPIRIGVVPIDDTDTVIHVRAEGLGPGASSPNVAASATLAFVPGRALVLPVILYRVCIDVTCGEGQTCVEREGQPLCISDTLRRPECALTDLESGLVEGCTDADAGVDAGEQPECTTCDDGIGCTRDVCLEEGECAHVPDVSRCNAGQTCDEERGCLTSSCTPPDCDDHDPCTADSCDVDQGRCEHSAQCPGERCCTGGSCAECCSDDDCEDGIACTDDTCDEGTCGHTSACGGGTPICCGDTCTECCVDEDCTATSACFTSQCEAGQCQDVPACGGATPICCADDTCHGCCVDGDCDDGLAYTDDSCNGAGQCEHSGTLACVDDSTCVGGACCGDGFCSGCCDAADCDDSDPCSVDTCLLGGCIHDSLECPDDGDPCTDPRCDPGTGACGSVPHCTAGEVCCNGSCRFDCCDVGDCVDDGNECTDAAQCNSGVCTSPNHTGSCTDDGNTCTSDECRLGLCDHLALDGFVCPAGTCCGDQCEGCCDDPDCADADPCTATSCNGGSCRTTPLADGDSCGPNLVCCGGDCRECCNAADCDDGSDCTTDTCDASGVCGHVQTCGGCQGAADCPGQHCCDGTCQACCDNSQCQDADPCTTNTCSNGLCTQVPTCGAQRCCGGTCAAQCCGNGECLSPPICHVLGNCTGGSCTYPNAPDSTPCTPDANPCTRDICTGGVCSHPIMLDGAACPGGVCCGGTCGGCCNQNDCAPPLSPCLVSVCTGNTCDLQPAADGTPCDGGASVCCGGSCCGGAGPCTTPQCTNGQCSLNCRLGPCGGTVGADGGVDVNPIGSCQNCLCTPSGPTLDGGP